MAIVMAGTATACLGSGNLKPAPRLGLRGGCHCCHYFYKSIRKIIIKVVCEIPGNAGNRPPTHTYQEVLRIILILVFGSRHEPS
jgi:hypothetical protein